MKVAVQRTQGPDSRAPPLPFSWVPSAPLFPSKEAGDRHAKVPAFTWTSWRRDHACTSRSKQTHRRGWHHKKPALVLTQKHRLQHPEVSTQCTAGTQHAAGSSKAAAPKLHGPLRVPSPPLQPPPPTSNSSSVSVIICILGTRP